MVKLDRRRIRDVPAAPGVYTAWIVEEDALEEVGVEGPAPVLAWVGKAERTLRGRLSDHVPSPTKLHRQPFIDLGDLLAVRGAVPLNLWARCLDKGPGHWNAPSGLGALAMDRTLGWQRDRLVWGWEVLPTDEIAAHETALINGHAPLLNRKGRGLRANPPQLRRIGRFERYRALWLAVLAGAAALAGAEPWRGYAKFPFDSLGYLSIDGVGTTFRPLLGFDEARVRRNLRIAARLAGVPSSLDPPPSLDEVRLWWGAAAAVGTLDEATVLTFLLGESGDATPISLPERLPSHGVTARLLAAIDDCLSTERH
jgi:hypothetical protein